MSLLNRIFLLGLFFAAAPPLYPNTDDLARLPAEVASIRFCVLETAGDITIFRNVKHNTDQILNALELPAEVTSATLAIRLDEEKKKTAYLIMHGDLDKENIIEHLENFGDPESKSSKDAPFESEEYRKIKIFHRWDGNQAFCFLDKKSFATGTLDVVKEMVDVKMRKALPASKDPYIRSVLPKISSSTAFWAINTSEKGKFKEKSSSKDLRRQAARNSRGLVANLASLSGDLNDHESIGTQATFKETKDGPVITLIFRNRLRDSNTASKIANTIRQAKSNSNAVNNAGRRRRPRVKEVASTLSNAQVSTNKNIITFKFICTENEFEKTFKTFGSTLTKNTGNAKVTNFPEKTEELKEEEGF